MLIEINKIHPNPYRDFSLYPLDEEQVEKLVQSFADNGDFGILPARPNGSPSTFQIAAGHHRLEAMRRLGFGSVDLKVDHYDEDQMVRIMVDENAKQMGQNAAAVLDSVAAAIRRIAYMTLTMDWDHYPEFRTVLYPDGEHAFTKAREAIEGGRGVGEAQITRYLGERLTRNKIDLALATIKASDLHIALVNKVKERIDAERREAEQRADEARQEAERIAEARAEAERKHQKAEAERKRKAAELEAQRKEAERQAKEAKQKREREIAELRQKEIAARQREEEERRKAQEELRRKRQAEAEKEAKEMAARRAKAEAEAKQRREASARASRASENVAAKAPEHKFDARISQVFKNDYQLDVFRKAITSGTLAKVLPEERQYACAEACKDWHKRNEVELTAKSITDWLSRELDTFLRHERKASKREQELAMKESADRAILREYDDLRDALVKITTVCVRLKEKYDAYPSEFEPPVNLSVARLMPRAIEDLKLLHTRLSNI